MMQLIENNGFLKSLGAIAIAFPCFYSLQTLADEDLYTSAEVNIHWAAQRPVPDDERSLYLQRASEIASFFKNHIQPAVPSRVWNDQAPPKLIVSFESGLPTDGGLFVPPETEVAKLEGSKKKTETRAPASHVEKVTVKIEFDLIKSKETERLLAHEYFHAVHWIAHKDEPAWLREGLAQVFETHVAGGKFNTTNLRAGFSGFSTPLTAKIDPSAISPAQYGHLLLYVWYLYQRCGGENLFWNIVVSSDGVFGEKSVETALKRESSPKIGCRSFQDSVVEAELARAINTSALDGDDRDRWFLLYTTLGRAKAQDSLPSPADWKSIEPWTPLLVSAPSTLTQWKVPSDGRAWWIRKDESPKVSETAKRPDSSFQMLLVLKLPPKPAQSGPRADRN